MPKQKPLNQRTVSVIFEPIGRRIEVGAGTSLLNAAQSAGVQIISICGGIGACNSCRVTIISGEFSPFTPLEEQALDESERSAGYRLACQAKVLTDAKIYIPAESLTTAQRLQIEGKEIEVEPRPVVVPIEVVLQPPTLHDLRADATRLVESLNEQGLLSPVLNYPILTNISNRLREHNWSARIACRDDEVVAILAPGAQLIGLAVDIGTTKLAGYLVDLSSGETIAKVGAMNPQISYGEDVISRIAYVNLHEDGRETLQNNLVEAINEMIQEMCTSAGVSQSQIVEAVVVGNTAMHHLFAGLPVRQLGMAPYVPAVSAPIKIPAHELGLDLAPSAKIFLPPVIAGYVGADHVAMLLATGIHQTSKKVIALDIGTNTEISLAANGGILCCSCASGPAFEGAHIKDGMRASPGAIERVQIAGEEIHLYTIERQPPVGICGSGILDAIAEMSTVGIINKNGKMREDHPLVRGEGKQTRVVLVEASESGHDREIAVIRKDVNEIQLAKGAIRAGIEILLAEAGLSYKDLDEIIVAGAFGTYLNTTSAIRIGMFPDLHPKQIRQVGNAAGVGAKQMLISSELRHIAVDFLQRVKYIELTTSTRFQEEFLKAMYF